MPKPVHAIVAVAARRVIGRAGRLPWSFPSDTAYFLATTRGGVMIEGPTCYAELGGALPDRDTIVISRDATKTFPGATRAGTFEEALELANRSTRPGPVWVAGGQWLYEAALPLCERLYVTEIGAEYPGDRFFPEWRATHPRVISAHATIESGTSLVFSVRARA
jgi:dihydrofolate reductase